MPSSVTPFRPQTAGEIAEESGGVLHHEPDGSRYGEGRRGAPTLDQGDSGETQPRSSEEDQRDSGCWAAPQ
jgi:hypothetical protein